MKKIVLAADHAGYALKQAMGLVLSRQGYTIEDLGCHHEESVDYPQIAAQLANALQHPFLEGEGRGEVRGLLFCGSGVGVCITANRFPWIRAVEAHDHNTVTLSRKHNDTNVLCLGGRVIAPELALNLIETWLSTPFDSGRHQKRVDMMAHLYDVNFLINGRPQGVAPTI